MHEVIGYSFPNDVHIHWSLMIVMYPYLTGLVAGAFIVSALYHLFGREEFRPIGRFSLLTSLAFLFFAPLPLLNHLGQPLRAMNIMITPHLTSAMAGFGFLLAIYSIIVVLEVWLIFRRDIVEIARGSRGLKRQFYKALALWVYDVSAEAQEIDHKAVLALTALGIPAACLLHGYVGFLFGALKANPWWSTPLMPIIFLFSAVMSGIALLIILYQVVCLFNGWAVNRETIRGLARWLWLFLILTVTLELLEIITLAYEKSEEWEVIATLLTTKLSVSFISIQMVLGALIPFILLMITVLLDTYLHDRVRNTLALIASLLLMLQVFAMRWNVVIGGQIFSKSLRGFRDYSVGLFEKEGILAAVALMVGPFVLLAILNRLLPSLTREAEPAAGPTP